MGWSSMAAVVTGGQLTLPVTGQQLTVVPTITAGKTGTAPNQQSGLGIAGPGLSQVNDKAFMQIVLWSDTAGGAVSAPAPGGAHVDIDYFDGRGGGATIAQVDGYGVKLAALGTPPTPASGCYIWYDGASLRAKGPSGNSVIIATT